MGISAGDTRMARKTEKGRIPLTDKGEESAVEEAT